MRQLSERHQSLPRFDANVKTRWCVLSRSNPLVPVNEVTSLYPSWATTGADELKWITAPKVHFSIGQDRSLLPLWSWLELSPKYRLASHNIFCPLNFDQRHTHTPLQMSRSSEAQENTPKESCWLFTLTSVCKSQMLLIRCTTFTFLYINCLVKIASNDTAASLLLSLIVCKNKGKERKKWLFVSLSSSSRHNLLKSLRNPSYSSGYILSCIQP